MAASKQFVEKQKAKLQAEFEAKAKERDAELLEEESAQAKREEAKRMKKARMSEYYAKQGHNLKDQEATERKELNDLWNHEQVQKVFKAYEKSYRPIFKQFAISDQKQEIGGQIEESQISMNSA